MKYKISQHLLILYSLTEPSDLMWLRLNIAIYLFYRVILFVNFIQIVIWCHWSCNLADCFYKTQIQFQIISNLFRGLLLFDFDQDQTYCFF